MIFFPSDVSIPDKLLTTSFTLRPLRGTDAKLDYEAYMASPDVIRKHSSGRWPTEGFTLAQDRQELIRHEERHRKKQDFAFILLATDETQSLGCVYIQPLMMFLQHASLSTTIVPPALTDSTAMVTFWIRQDRQQTSLSTQLVIALHHWLLSQWPFDRHFFRVNPQEHESIQSLEQHGFSLYFETAVAESSHRHLFFEKFSTPSEL